MDNKVIAWELTLPDGQCIGGVKRLYIPQDWNGLEDYFKEVQAQMLQETLKQQPKKEQ